MDCLRRERRGGLGLASAAVLVLGAAAAAPAARALPAEADACLACHAPKGAGPDPKLSAFDHSAHKSLACTACHAGAADLPHPARLAPVDCALCHPGPARALAAGPHGRSIRSRFRTLSETCAVCHGPAHAVLPAASSKSQVTRARQPATCGACHGEEGLTPPRIEVHRPLESYLQTIHGEALRAGNLKAAACADCHGSHDIRPAGDGGSKVARARIPATCGACHAGELAQFKASVHGRALAQGLKEAPVCTDCHGEHTIRPPGETGSPAWRGAISRTCSGCHASQKIAAKFGLPMDRVSTFQDSFHGMAGRGGDLKVANCASCHGWHDVLPSSDPASRVSPARLAETCGQCHPGAGARLAGSRVHVSLAAEGGGSRVAGWIRTFYLVFIPLLIGAMLLHNSLDLLRKALAPGPLARLRKEEIPALTVNERFQHGGLILAFGLLAWSGFALKFPGHWWDAPLALFGGEEPRRTVHRAAALAFVLVAAFHAAYLVGSRKGRARLRALLPGLRDLRDPLRLVLFNLGLSGERPLLERFSYIEKAEYYGLVWGSAVMVLTGGVLVFHNFALAHFPLWVIEVCRIAHFLEAVLACLSILVWHFYWVIFDPEVYPMDWAWLTGRPRLGGGEK